MFVTLKVSNSLHFKRVRENPTFHLSTFITEIPVNVMYCLPGFLFFGGFFLNQESALSGNFQSMSHAFLHKFSSFLPSR